MKTKRLFHKSKYGEIIDKVDSIWEEFLRSNIAQKMKFPIQDFFSKCDQIRSFLRIWSHLLKKSLMQNFIFCAVQINMIIKSEFIVLNNTKSSSFFAVCNFFYQAKIQPFS